MAKRKASEVASSAGDGSKSPTRKKSKKEQLAAAKEWHDKRNFGDKAVADAVPSNRVGSARGAAMKKQQVTTSTTTHKKTDTKSSTAASNKQQSSLFDDEKSSTNSSSGGNALLKLLRKQKDTSSTKSEVVAEAPSPIILNGNATSVSASLSSATNTTSHKTARETILLFLFFGLLNIAGGAYMIYNQQISITNFHKQHISDVEQLKAELAKSKDVNALLQSGISVLEQKLKTKKLAINSNNLHHISNEEDDSDTSKGGIYNLEMEKKEALDGFDTKLISLGYDGVKNKIVEAIDTNLCKEQGTCDDI